MRIGIREQLGLLVLLTTLTALAVVAIATVLLTIFLPSLFIYTQQRHADNYGCSGSTITILCSASGMDAMVSFLDQKLISKQARRVSP